MIAREGVYQQGRIHHLRNLIVEEVTFSVVPYSIGQKQIPQGEGISESLTTRRQRSLALVMMPTIALNLISPFQLVPRCTNPISQ